MHTVHLQLLPQHVVFATITSSPFVRILVLLLGLKRLGSNDAVRGGLVAAYVLRDTRFILLFLYIYMFRVRRCGRASP